MKKLRRTGQGVAKVSALKNEVNRNGKKEAGRGEIPATASETPERADPLPPDAAAASLLAASLAAIRSSNEVGFFLSLMV